ncbi:MAG: Unknown protein [uncultured Aureispira sp.]|uniref:GLPGLI family protein n=1 Tax=uncultured Aureispira sp. TaxID=1331704 RepID=A0A6S6SDU0_9BACT|nr:MAG: Unknown protein [uncultured Aureispira sp.]
MRIILIILLLSCFVQKVSATFQIPDRLIYEGKTYNLHKNPLEVYFKEHPRKRPEGDISTTALWRGYIATFEIENKLLVLKDLQIQVYQHRKGKQQWRPNVVLKSVLKDVFPEGECFKIDWCTEILMLPSGKIKNDVQHTYTSIFEQYVLLEMKGGVLMESKTFDHTGYLAFKKQQLERFKRTEEYQTHLTKWKEKYEYTEAEVHEILEVSLFNYLTTFLE